MLKVVNGVCEGTVVVLVDVGEAIDEAMQHEYEHRDSSQQKAG